MYKTSNQNNVFFQLSSERIVDISADLPFALVVTPFKITLMKFVSTDGNELNATEVVSALVDNEITSLSSVRGASGLWSKNGHGTVPFLFVTPFLAVTDPQSNKKWICVPG